MLPPFPNIYLACFKFKIVVQNHYLESRFFFFCHFQGDYINHGVCGTNLASSKPKENISVCTVLIFQFCPGFGTEATVLAVPRCHNTEIAVLLVFSV